MSAPEEGVRAALGARVANSMDAMMSRVIRPLISRAATFRPPGGRRFCLLHLDGVSREVLRTAIRRGYAPFLGRLLMGGGYALSPCWSGAPASTPAFQAGLLYGAHEPDIPSYLWFDRASRREVRMDCAEDAARVEAELARRGPGLLREGSAHFSVFSGQAEVNGFTMAGWAAQRMRLLTAGMDRWHLAAAAAAHTITAGRIAGRLLKEVAGAALDLVRHSALVGRLQHEPTFLLHRLGLALGAREAATWLTVTDIARGVPGIYTCFGDYDEIAHRRGPESTLALLALWGIDRAVARIFAAAASVPEMGYEIYVVADHGQVPTRPFEAVTGLSLLDYLALALPAPDGPPRVSGEMLREVSRLRGYERAAQALPASMRRRASRAVLEAARALAHRRNQSETVRLLDEVVCIDAGDVAQIYLGREKRPLQIEEIQQGFSRVLEVLIRSPAVGIVAARGGRAGVAWVRGHRVDLADPSDVDRLGIGYGGRMVAQFLRKMLRIRSAGDLVVYGNGVPGGDVAFSWEFGSHAGVARQEVETFVIHPSRVDFDFTAVQHGADLHDFLVERFQPAGEPLARAEHQLQ